jgi:hypothetical protein
VSQDLSLSSTATGALSFWLRVTSNEKSTSARDYLYVEVTDGTRTDTLAVFSNLDRIAPGSRPSPHPSWVGKLLTLRSGRPSSRPASRSTTCRCSSRKDDPSVPLPPGGRPQEAARPSSFALSSGYDEW